MKALSCETEYTGRVTLLGQGMYNYCENTQF